MGEKPGGGKSSGSKFSPSLEQATQGANRDLAPGTWRREKTIPREQTNTQKCHQRGNAPCRQQQAPARGSGAGSERGRKQQERDGARAGGGEGLGSSQGERQARGGRAGWARTTRKAGWRQPGEAEVGKGRARGLGN